MSSQLLLASESQKNIQGQPWLQISWALQTKWPTPLYIPSLPLTMTGGRVLGPSLGLCSMYTALWTKTRVSFHGGYPEKLLQKWQESPKYLFGEAGPNDQSNLFLRCGDTKNIFPLMFGSLQGCFEAHRVGEECYINKRSFPLSFPLNLQQDS